MKLCSTYLKNGIIAVFAFFVIQTAQAFVLEIKTGKQAYALAEPVALYVSIENTGDELANLPAYLGPDFQEVNYTVSNAAAGGDKQFVSWIIKDTWTPVRAFASGEIRKEEVKLFFSAQGWTYPAPGTYTITAEFAGQSSNTLTITVGNAAPGALRSAESDEADAVAQLLLRSGQAGFFLLFEGGPHLVKGIEILEQIVADYPNTPHAAHARTALGNYQRELGNYQEALALLNAAKEQPAGFYNVTHTHAFLYRAHMAAGNAEEAEAVLLDLEEAVLAQFSELISFAGIVLRDNGVPPEDAIYSISGHIFDNAVTPLAGAAVRVSGYDQAAVTDENGHYQIDGLRPGAYALFAEQEGYQFDPGQAHIAGDGTSSGVDFISFIEPPQPQPVLLTAVQSCDGAGIVFTGFDGQETHRFDTENAGVYLDAADLDGDGVTDIAVTQIGKGDDVLMLDASGGETGAILTDLGKSGIRAVFADLDNDGVFEAVIAKRAATDRVYVYRQDGTLDRELKVFDNAVEFDLAAGDMNGDGRDEIVLAAAAPVDGDTVFIFNGEGGPPVQSFAASLSGALRVITGDTDADGADEIIVGEAAGYGIAVYTSDGVPVGAFEVFGENDGNAGPFPFSTAGDAAGAPDTSEPAAEQGEIVNPFLRAGNPGSAPDTDGTGAETGETVLLCHIPPGNPAAAHTLGISAEALQTHLDHGDHEGSCEGGGGDKKAALCHIPPGNPGNAHTLSVSVSALQTHLAHGDYEGSCEGGAGCSLYQGPGAVLTSGDVNGDGGAEIIAAEAGGREVRVYTAQGGFIARFEAAGEGSVITDAAFAPNILMNSSLAEVLPNTGKMLEDAAAGVNPAVSAMEAEQAVEEITVTNAVSGDWEIREVYSNEDGSVQFIKLYHKGELQTPFGGSVLTACKNDMAQCSSITFPENMVSPPTNELFQNLSIPSDEVLQDDWEVFDPEDQFPQQIPCEEQRVKNSLSPECRERAKENYLKKNGYGFFLLIGTRTLELLPGGVKPDHEISPGFLFTENAYIRFSSSGTTARLDYSKLPTDGQCSLMNVFDTAQEIEKRVCAYPNPLYNEDNADILPKYEVGKLSFGNTEYLEKYLNENECQKYSVINNSNPAVYPKVPIAFRNTPVNYAGRTGSIALCPPIEAERLVAQDWEIQELYSNEDGSVQFIELYYGGNEPISPASLAENFAIHTCSGESVDLNSCEDKLYEFARSNRVEQASLAGGDRLLLATPGFEALPGGVKPDYIIPFGFLPVAKNVEENGVAIEIRGGVVFVDKPLPSQGTPATAAKAGFTYSGLPVNGICSLSFPPGNTGQVHLVSRNSPVNYFGETGSMSNGHSHAIYDAVDGILRIPAVYWFQSDTSKFIQDDIDMPVVFDSDKPKYAGTLRFIGTAPEGTPLPVEEWKFEMLESFERELPADGHYAVFYDNIEPVTDNEYILNIPVAVAAADREKSTHWSVTLQMVPGTDPAQFKLLQDEDGNLKGLSGYLKSSAQYPNIDIDIEIDMPECVRRKLMTEEWLQASRLPWFGETGELRAEHHGVEHTLQTIFSSVGINVNIIDIDYPSAAEEADKTLLCPEPDCFYELPEDITDTYYTDKELHAFMAKYATEAPAEDSEDENKYIHLAFLTRHMDGEISGVMASGGISGGGEEGEPADDYWKAHNKRNSVVIFVEEFHPLLTTPTWPSLIVDEEGKKVAPPDTGVSLNTTPEYISYRQLFLQVIGHEIGHALNLWHADGDRNLDDTRDGERAGSMMDFPKCARNKFNCLQAGWTYRWNMLRARHHFLAHRPVEKIQPSTDYGFLTCHGEICGFQCRHDANAPVPAIGPRYTVCDEYFPGNQPAPQPPADDPDAVPDCEFYDEEFLPVQ
ncbi:MAG: hypothetical protein GY862_18620 [Gammaproteobacteria bacterium]|nr:hypothetical protein [Gammaproteobacteria bacterium]